MTTMRNTEANMKTVRTYCCCWVAGLLLLVAATSVVTASEQSDAGDISADQMLYIIKVTPTLVYLDAGMTSGIDRGTSYVVLRERDRGDEFARVGQVRVIRVDEEFCIAEILEVEMGEEIDVLQRAISQDRWDSMTAMAMTDMAGPMGPQRRGGWSLHLVGGADLNKAAELARQGTALTGTNEIMDASAGLRLARILGHKGRLNFTVRASGLMPDADVNQLSFEVDWNYLFSGVGSAGPYFGVGVGEHRLSGDLMGSGDSAFKTGFNGVFGLHLPVGQNGWSWELEAGYQHVMKWNNTVEIDASHARVHLGVGRRF